MTENKRFKLVDDYLIEYDGDYFDLHKPSDIRSLVTVIKYVTDENEQLKFEIEKLSYAHEDLLKEKRIWKQMSDEYSILYDENEQLKQQIKKLEAQLYKVEDGVCDICNNMYLVQQDRYFVSKCKKGHDECSKMDLEYCDDFELKGDWND